MIAARLAPVLDLDRYCVETRDALAAALNLDVTDIDHNLDAITHASGETDRVIWHEVLGDLGPSAVSAFRWSPTVGWEYAAGRFNYANPHLNRWVELDVRPDCEPGVFAAAAAAKCGRALRCAHCGARLQVYGGIWFMTGGGATCHRAPGKQHSPLAIQMPDAG